MADRLHAAVPDAPLSIRVSAASRKTQRLDPVTAMALSLHPNEGIPGQTRHLIVILGDPLDAGSPALGGLDPGQDLVWMCEAVEESTIAAPHPEPPGIVSCTG